MRNCIIVFIAVITLYGCGDEIQFNNPALQANKDGEHWKALFYASDIDFGGFLVEGGNNIETIQLFTFNDTRGTFELGGDTDNVAIFRDANGVVYSTANTPDPSLSVYPPNGQIIVDDISNTTPKTIRGTFWFNAYTADGLNYINFNEGVFYNIPLLGGLEIITN